MESLHLTALIVLLIILTHSKTPASSTPPAPVRPSYNLSLVSSFFLHPIPEDVTIQQLKAQNAIEYQSWACLGNTQNAGHSRNGMFVYPNRTEMPNAYHMNGTTYWFNEWLHVGHVWYEIALMQALQVTPIDRIVSQRAVCANYLCSTSIGPIDSFYKGFFAAAFLAAKMDPIPVYLRWSWRERVYHPLYYIWNTSDYLHHPAEPDGTLAVHQFTCYDRVIRRTDTKLGAIPTISTRARDRFKQAAYKIVGLTSFSLAKAPSFVIGFAYRSGGATRKIVNQEEFVDFLRQSFPASAVEGTASRPYEIRLLDTSSPTLNFTTQMSFVGQCHVVIATHGAFEVNMIYMQTHALLVEIFGEYFIPEVHSFHRLALMFGLYYARINAQNFTNHKAPSFELSKSEMVDIKGMIGEYFERKPFLATV